MKSLTKSDDKIYDNLLECCQEDFGKLDMDMFGVKYLTDRLSKRYDILVICERRF